MNSHSDSTHNYLAKRIVFKHTVTVNACSSSQLYVYLWLLTSRHMSAWVWLSWLLGSLKCIKCTIIHFVLKLFATGIQIWCKHCETAVKQRPGWKLNPGPIVIMVARLHFTGVVVESKNVFFIDMMLPDLHLHIHTLNSNNVCYYSLQNWHSTWYCTITRFKCRYCNGFNCFSVCS